jgi:hypothetical protein
MRGKYPLQIIPADVLAAFDTLPADILDAINIQIVVTSGCTMAVKHPHSITEQQCYEHILAMSKEHIRLIRVAIKVHEGGA